jgi:hypothetical protein
VGAVGGKGAAYLEGKEVVGEDDYLVAALLVHADQVLARLELARIHHIEQLALPIPPRTHRHMQKHQEKTQTLRERKM